MLSTVVAVPNIKQREFLINTIKRKYQLKALEESGIKIVQDRVHRIQIWKDDHLTMQVTVVLVPVIVNTEQLFGYGGSTKIHVDYIKQELIKWIKKLDEISEAKTTDSSLTEKLVGEI
jgi:hypothetical protein